MTLSDIGVYGLGVMGRNLALNLEEHGFRVSLYNRTMARREEGVVERFLSEYGGGKQFNGTYTPADFVATIEKPRKILMMVKAGAAVDSVIRELTPYLDKGDILIDGGNSHYKDTRRRINRLSKKGVHFIGMGVSGGAEGARHGPSLMPGGNPAAWNALKPILEPIAATSSGGKPCCIWIGEGGSGHFVKMVHNGIEYADMELIAEACHLMKSGLNMTNDEIGETFRKWDKGRLNGYLVEITADIFRIRDKNGEPVVDSILDVAGQKGTGMWATESALDLEVPLPVATAAVFSRIMSNYKELRTQLADQLTGPEPSITESRDKILDSLESAFLAARIVAYAEGFFLIQKAGERYGWHIDPGEIAVIWTGGCIIRSALLDTISKAFREVSDGSHLLEAGSIIGLLSNLQLGWRNLVSAAFRHGIPVPGLASALTQYDTLRSGRLPHYLIQAQRDYFGAHRYERVDQPRGSFFHSNWRELARGNESQG